MAVQESEERSPFRNVAANAVTFTIGAEADNARAVAVQVQYGAADVAAPVGLMAYLSDSADGGDVAGTAPSGGVAAGTDGVLIPVVAGKAFYLISEADGDIDITITETGTDTWYLVIVLPNGRLVVSEAISFA